MIDLEYRTGSLLPPVSPERWKRFNQWLSEAWDRRIRLPAAYQEHLTQFHGGVPGRNRFVLADGEVRRIGRFFHYLEDEEPLPGEHPPSWRTEWGSPRGLLLDYAVQRFLTAEYWGLRLQEHEETLELLPIAGLLPEARPDGSLDDEDEFDLLCLDFSKRGAPPVVVWKFTNDWNDPPVILPVARSFAELLAGLDRD